MFRPHILKTLYNYQSIPAAQNCNLRFIHMKMSSSHHPDFRVIFAPQPYTKTGPTIFLSGSIDAPPATWQKKLTDSLSHLPITIINPHRPDWDSSWKEEISFEPFREQVNWELDGIEKADVIAVYFGKDSKAPISLMELGLGVRKGQGRMVVACPAGFYKRGNVQIVCGRFGVEVVNSVEELRDGVVKALEKLGVLGEDINGSAQ
jgi:hypothetical protein